MKRIFACLIAVLLLFTLLSGCNKKEPSATIVIYDGQFSEMRIIHRMVKLLVESNTDIKVDIRDEMSPTNCYNELLKGNGDLFNCYDGTLLTTFLHLDPADVPAGTSLYDYVNAQAADKGIELLDKLGTNNTYMLAVPQEIAEKYQLETISDLAAVAHELTFGAEHEFFTEDGSAKFNPLAAFYGLNFRDVKQIDLSLKYTAIQSGNIDVTVVYATDGLNRQANLKVLQDDRSFFPEYNGALLVSTDLFVRMEAIAPNLRAVLNLLGDSMTNEDMTDMTYAVDIGGRTPEDVAREFLVQKGLLD